MHRCKRWVSVCVRDRGRCTAVKMATGINILWRDQQQHTARRPHPQGQNSHRKLADHNKLAHPCKGQPCQNPREQSWHRGKDCEKNEARKQPPKKKSKGEAAKVTYVSILNLRLVHLPGQYHHHPHSPFTKGKKATARKH